MRPPDLSEAVAFNSIAWILSNNIVNENASPMEFSDHAFLVDPFLDNTPKQAIRKCAQVGWSTLAILRSFHLARYAGANIIHTFPSRNMSKDFVIPKVNPLIYNNPAIKDMVSLDSINLKKVGERFIYYRGSYEQTEAISISANILINDEYDRSNQYVLRTYRSRLDDTARERPELGWEWQFSNPSIPGQGVDALWLKSDQKHWFVRCRHCRHEWYLKFPDNLDFENKKKICAKCHGVFSRVDLQKGRWVKKFKDRDVSGYWISQMFVPWISADKIIADSEGDPEIFHNFVLGLPYISKDTSVTRESIIRCLVPGSNPRTNVAIGVDNGIKKHYVVGNRFGIFEVGVTEDWQDIENLRNRYQAVMVIDSNPYPTQPARLAQKYPGKIFAHFYQPDKKNIGTIRWEQNVVKSDRTKIIDHVVAEINATDINFNMTERALEEYIFHWQQVYRIIESTPLGIMKPKWETGEGKPDHFAHATVYWRIALEQTLGLGGIASPPAPGFKKGQPVISADQTVPALDLKEVVKRATAPRRSWKSV